MEHPVVDVVVPVFEPTDDFIKMLRMLYGQGSIIRKVILVITRSEKAVYPDLFHYPGIVIHAIDPEYFDHAGSRNLGFSLSDADYVLMMTQDAIPESSRLAEKLLAPFEDEAVAVSYARQIPRDDCDPIEFYTRQFNYSEESRVKSLDDVATLGLKAYFCSDACAMYKRSVFEELGRFSAPVIFNEDMMFAHKALHAGYKIAYAADACVIHSHNMTGKKQYQRSFDMGVSHAMHPEVFSGVSAEGSGKAMMKDVIKNLARDGSFIWIVKFLYQCGMRYLGYRKGRNYKNLSRETILKYTMNPRFWEGKYGTDQSNKV